MSWFKRKEQNIIPPVEFTPSERPPSYKSSRDFNSSSPNIPYERSYSKSNEAGSFRGEGINRNQGVTDPYSRGERDLNQDRNELFAGYTPDTSGVHRFVDGPERRKTPPPGEEDDEDVEGIKQQTKYVKQESVNSTRNALRIAREAEETARNTLGRLGDQSEKLGITERHLDTSKGHSLRAEDTAIEIKQLNRSIFIPAITLNKQAKRAAQEQKRQQRLDEEREEREKAMLDIRETNNRLGRAAAYSSSIGTEDDELLGNRRIKTQSERDIQKEQRKRFQFEANASDDELEDELDGNLGEISDMTKRLKSLGTAMGQELDRQNERIQRIESKTVRLDDKIHSNTERLKRIR